MRAFSTLNEGPGRTLWFGVGDDEAVERLRFFRDELGPTLARLLEHRGPIDVFNLAAQGLNMGDELHMRSQATGNLLMRDLLSAFAALGGEASARFIAGNHHFFLNLTMAACKCASLAASGVDGSSVVTLMSRNGTDVGIAARRDARALVHRARRAGPGHAAARGLHGRRRGARHRRLGRDRVLRARRDGARRRARGRGVLRRGRGGGDGAHRADGGDLRRALYALRDRRDAARRWASTRGWSPSSTSRRRSPPACCTRARVRGRSAPAWRTSRRSRSATRCWRSTRRCRQNRPDDRRRARTSSRGRTAASACRTRRGLDEASLRAWLIGRRVYRRTEFIVAVRDCERAVVQVERESARDVRVPVRDLRVLAGPDDVAFVADPAVDTGNASPDGAGVASGGARDVVQGRFEHVNFIVAPAPVRGARAGGGAARAAEAAGDGAAVLDYDEDLPPVELAFDPIDLRALAAAHPAAALLFPCRCARARPRRPVDFLDAGPPELADWTLVGCERSRQIHVALYGARAGRARRLLPPTCGSRDRGRRCSSAACPSAGSSARARHDRAVGRRRSRRSARRCAAWWRTLSSLRAPVGDRRDARRCSRTPGARGSGWR